MKFELSHADVAQFHFRDGSMDIDITVTRDDFRKLDRRRSRRPSSAASTRSSKLRGISRRQVDRVFLTGGTRFVPAVRRIFESRFGAHRIRTGNEFISVARGLALRADEVLAS